MKFKKAQAGIEYLIVVGFVTFIVIGILGIAFFYSNSVRDKIKTTQLSNFANKLISTCESVFYAGEPSKATITAYLPENVDSIEILDNELIFTYQTSTGVNKISFSSNVPISGTLGSSSGLRRIQVLAQQNQVVISQI